ncbi:glutamate-5-semialdehyde dehydrogenase [Hippea maritima]|uniref:Gamma-glutamyl phosphate reductase n=1 Tax=Hippea maritima (strain ATCC 700847 / DSM 10411 / MH2) TaxID=760142 RepID=F2LY00_HIPMA|nr:glutamate-5-semialdehyde dehydrogenase [Hippea maritima]AEA33265.1 Gamma-glutamyl phosphate reductase [Hippea maritima DSM 10411]
MSLKERIEQLAHNTKTASQSLAKLTEDRINAALEKLAELIDKNRHKIKEINEIDIKNAKKINLKASLIDRLLLNDKRIDGMIEAVETVIKLKSPVGKVIDGWRLENGLNIERVKVPIGCLGIIYESRPNVTVDASILCLKSSNGAILKGGKEAINSNRLLVGLIKEALSSHNINENVVNFIDETDRDAVLYMLKLDKYIDAIVPRGGEGLIRFVSENATMPVIKHDKGLCHGYVDESADLEKALSITYNAKVQRPGVCNALETLLVHKNIAQEFLVKFKELMDSAGVELRGCSETLKILPDIKLAEEDDWHTEYLDLILSIKIVDSIDEAIEHINRYGSHHSETIITENHTNAERFLDEVDAACVYVNASTRFTDGGVFGFGAEIGISTNKLHARGPVGLDELTTYKYKIRGNGQIRE